MEGNMYAIIETGGKQYKVSPGQTIEVDGLVESVGETLEIGNVLLLSDDGNVVVGTPTVPGVSVNATVVEQGRGRKVTVFKFSRGNRYHSKRGHRQGYTTLQIVDIVRGGAKKRPAPAKPAEKQEVAAPEDISAAPDVAIEDLGLPSRVAGALKGAGLETVADLVEKEDAELLAIRGFGAKSLEQVRAALKDKGFIKE
jgi:large subunit ribosomal protein L21